MTDRHTDIAFQDFSKSKGKMVECYCSSGLHSAVSAIGPRCLVTRLQFWRFSDMVNGAGIKIIHVTLIRDILRVTSLIIKSFPRHNNYDKKKYKILKKILDHTCTNQTASKKRLNIKIPLASAHWLIKNQLTQCTLDKFCQSTLANQKPAYPVYTG